MSKKEQVCMYCNKEKGVIVDSWTLIYYCAKCMWKQSEKQSIKWDPRRGERTWAR